MAALNVNKTLMLRRATKKMFQVYTRTFHRCSNYKYHNIESKLVKTPQYTFGQDKKSKSACQWVIAAAWTSCALSMGWLIKEYDEKSNRKFMKETFRTFLRREVGSYVGLLVHAAQPISKNEDSSAGERANYRQQFNFIADIVENVIPAVVFINSRSRFYSGSGSGFIVSTDGLIITNAHVVHASKNSKVDVQLSNGCQYTGTVEIIESSSDLALVKINASGLPTLNLGTSDTLRLGEWVVAVGSPLQFSNTVTSGVVSSTRRSSKELGIPNEINCIQTDAPMTFGNSGGPLINLDGEVVGVNSMKVADGISFTIPSDYVKTFLLHAEQLMNDEKARKEASVSCYTGITTRTLIPSVIAEIKRNKFHDFDVEQGVYVWKLDNGSPAYIAGVRRWDMILKVDGKVLDTASDYYRSINVKNELVFTIRRNKKIFDFVVRPIPLVT